MARTDLKISTKTSEGKSSTTTVSYVNPEASAAVLKELAVNLVNLTDDTYVSGDRVNTVNIDTESPTIKQTPTFTASAQTVSATGGSVVLTYSGDATNIWYYSTHRNCALRWDESPLINNHSLLVAQVGGDIPRGTIIHVMVPETDNYKSAELTITVQ